ncbi:MAG: di-trans,poly-cis-decaprenylcistransferase [Dehalococcoidia bacterium]|nr:di-trans,poly-cis-decaprenylcistransferase [Dehalococcoidia bacterium]
MPNHVAIIMDGNGRWAEKRGLPRLAGHSAGTDNVRRVIKCFNDYDVKYITIYAFSTENWSRPQREVQGLMRIMEDVIDREAENLHKDGVKLIHLGNLDGISEKLKQKLQYAIKLTEDNSRGTLCIAFNYGGRAEIIDAIKRIIRDGILPNEIDEALISYYLYTINLPDPDLIIRTGGEMRLSNFLIWQAAYSEYYATPTLWPDFGPEEIEQALIAYSERERRFGGLIAEG